MSEVYQPPVFPSDWFTRRTSLEDIRDQKPEESGREWCDAVSLQFLTEKLEYQRRLNFKWLNRFNKPWDIMDELPPFIGPMPNIECPVWFEGVQKLIKSFDLPKTCPNGEVDSVGKLESVEEPKPVEPTEPQRVHVEVDSGEILESVDETKYVELAEPKPARSSSVVQITRFPT